ncbi:hypothetical protein G3576_12150 [Roseomonas stagni]|uniref:Uncharacterized protein n=1 Tax=Falsiroseomonas algicola TaxID=2716930 RepID=A0A6M1LKN8_9PROT|nr:hypothetical protein [Falsiroseomonas algicola]NGM20767.1 hypothetical protein [Falsiroseomonas algicola]
MDYAGMAALAWGGMEAVAAILIALLLLRGASGAFALAAPHDAEAVPLLHVAALGTGLALGLAILLALPHGEAFRLAQVFDGDGRWTQGLGAFLAASLLPGRETLGAALVALRSIDGPAGFAGLLTLAGLLAGAAVAMRLWRGMARLRALVAFLLLAACVALLLHYAAHLAAWLAARLNFWVFALLLLGFQRWRYAPRAAH